MSKKVVINCASIGSTCTFTAEVEGDADVNHLREAIVAKRTKFGDIHFDVEPSSLKLYLARGKSSGVWLKENDSLYELLMNKKKLGTMLNLQYIQLDPDWRLDRRDLLGKNFKSGFEEITVLVELPHTMNGYQMSKLVELRNKLTVCPSVGDLPRSGDFMEIFKWEDGDRGQMKDITEINDIVEFTTPKFYVRKEVLCVLDNFKRMYLDELEKRGNRNDKRFILLGSPGTGKSCILALLCFFITVNYKIPVVWRRVDGDRRLTRIFYEGKHYTWTDPDAIVYTELYYLFEQIMRLDVWFFVDGMSYADLKTAELKRCYDFLAPAGQFELGDGAFDGEELCLLPYWKRDDLSALSRRLFEWQEDEIDERFFWSGGNLRNFLSADYRGVVTEVLDRRIAQDDLEHLLTSNGFIGSNEYTERIGSRGVLNTERSEDYTELWKWVFCFTSKAVLHRFATTERLGFFEKLMSVVATTECLNVCDKMLGVAPPTTDASLVDVAFEAYFHALVRRKGPSIRLHWENIVDVKRAKGWERTKGVITTPMSVMKCGGITLAECEAEMQRWGEDPSSMEYWIPSTSLLNSIDAVVKWTKEGVQTFCFLKITKLPDLTVDTGMLRKLAQPLVVQKQRVCYFVITPSAETQRALRVYPQNIRDGFGKKIPIATAYFEIGDA